MAEERWAAIAKHSSTKEEVCSGIEQAWRITREMIGGNVRGTSVTERRAANAREIRGHICDDFIVVSCSSRLKSELLSIAGDNTAEKEAFLEKSAKCFASGFLRVVADEIVAKSSRVRTCIP